MRQAAFAAVAGQTGVAIRHTREALRTAQALLADVLAGLATGDHTDYTLAALVVAHHNLADLYHAAHLPDQAAAHVCRAHATLMSLAANAANAAEAALGQAAWGHSRETHAALLMFVRERGAHPAVVEALETHAGPMAGGGLPRH